MKERYQGQLDIRCSNSLRGADFYTNTGSIRKAIDEILSSMAEYGQDYPAVSIDFCEDDIQEHGSLSTMGSMFSQDSVAFDKNERQRLHEEGFTSATIIISQEGSFPTHDFDRDMRKLHEGGGTLANIRKALIGYAGWTIESRWESDKLYKSWQILDEEEVNTIFKPIFDGFTHFIKIIYKV